MLYNVVLVSALQQSESAIRIYVSPLFWIPFPFRVVVAQSLGRIQLFWDPKGCNTADSSVLFYLLELTQIHVH